jgi:signal peptidase I
MDHPETLPPESTAIAASAVVDDPAAPATPPPAASPGPLSEPPELPPAPEAVHPEADANHAFLLSLRLLLKCAVGFIILFLFLRTLAVEPFGVPTGSMAPALIGNHRESPCTRCGFPVRIGAPSGGGDAPEHYSRVACPNCGKHLSLTDSRDISGDRLLVDKNVYNLRRPRRWEMAVFRCPDPDPREHGKPYVKRIVGLPGETIRIIDGEVYANGELLRKDMPEIRETRILVFDMDHAPEHAGWNSRWLVEPPENDPRLPRTTLRAAEVADALVLRDGMLILDAGLGSAAVTYRNWNLDERKLEAIRSWSSYDGYPQAFHHIPPAHDFCFECDIEVVAATPEAVFAARLFDGADAVNAEIAVGPRPAGLVTLSHDGKGGLANASGVSLEPGRKHHVEFAFFDRRALLAIDGKVVAPAAELPAHTQRGEVSRPVQLGARGCHLVIRHFKLYRDVYYTQFGENGTLSSQVLGDKEYFVLGDNSANSQDSRKWPVASVPEGDFIGKPFLIHQPLRPSRLSLGGKEKVFQTVDWSRLRWLH